MAGMFEIFNAEGRGFQFRLKAADGTVMALSRPFPDKQAAVAGIMAVRECAGMGLIADLCPEIPVGGPSAPPGNPEAGTTGTGVPGSFPRSDPYARRLHDRTVRNS
jgi:uncharacterized protein YegP (UPF0339 family)